MAASPAIPVVSHHFRSISLPSESHQLTLSVEEHLCRLRSSELASSSSPSSICQNLAGLQDLYDSVDDLLQSSAAQKSISTGDQKSLDQTIDASLKILDVCGTSRDMFSQMKQNLQDLQSNIRRRGAESCFASTVRTYMSSRKEGGKCIHKCLSNMKKMENKSINEESGIIKILNEVEIITLAVFESLLAFVSVSKPNSLSLVSKLMHMRMEASNRGDNEIVKADAALKSLIGNKMCKSVLVKDIQQTLEALETSLEGVEDGLELLFRRLIKTRVSILNILNQ